MAVQWDRVGKGGLIGCGVLAGGVVLVSIALAVALVVGIRSIDWNFDFDLGGDDPDPALTAAVEACDVAKVESELEKGGRLFDGGRFELFGDEGVTIESALGCGPEMATLLTRYVVENDGGDPVLQAAVRTRSPEILAAVVAAGADLDAVDDAGDSPLLTAVTIGDRAMVELLLLAGADPAVDNEAGHTPLFRAVAFDRSDLVDALLAGGASTEAAAAVTDRDVLTLGLALAGEELEAGETVDTRPELFDRIDLLLEPLGARLDPGAQWAVDDVTPLYLAVAVSGDEVVSALLAAGADPGVGAGPNRHLPADAADLLGRTEVAALIRAAGG